MLNLNLHYYPKYYASSGVTFHISIILAFMFWTVHIIHIWITVDLPNVAFTKKLKTHSKVVHIAVVSACILLSIIGPIVALAKYSYVVVRVPALTCSPDDLDFVFYTLILPCVLLIATSTSFLVLLFWTVYKVCIELKRIWQGHVRMSAIMCPVCANQCVNVYTVRVCSTRQIVMYIFILIHRSKKFYEVENA